MPREVNSQSLLWMESIFTSNSTRYLETTPPRLNPPRLCLLGPPKLRIYVWCFGFRRCVSKVRWTCQTIMARTMTSTVIPTQSSLHCRQMDAGSPNYYHFQNCFKIPFDYFSNISDPCTSASSILVGEPSWGTPSSVSRCDEFPPDSRQKPTAYWPLGIWMDLPC